MVNDQIETSDEHILLDKSELPSGLEHISLDAQQVKAVLVKKRIQGISTGRKLVMLLAALVLIGATAYGIKHWWGSADKLSYATALVSQGIVTQSIEATGTLQPVRTSDMGFKNDDIIIALDVQPGDHVTVGQVLARQDPAALRNALTQAQNAVDQDYISMKSTQLNLETSRKELERQQQLFDAQAISQTELETAQNSLTKAGLDLQLAQAKLASDQTKLAQAQEDMAEATIVAPFDGIIGAVNGQVGSINGINSSSSTLLTVMSDELQMNALVNEADIGQVQVGQTVEFTSSSFGEKTFNGRVLRITPQATTVSNVQYYPVLISCEDPEKVLLSGMSVSAQIIVARETDSVLVPMMAVTYGQTYLKNNPNPALALDTKAVLVMENSQPVVKMVELGISDGNNYAVESGLNPGESVIIGTTSTQAGNSDSNTDTTQRSTDRNPATIPGSGIGGPPPGGF